MTVQLQRATTSPHPAASRSARLDSLTGLRFFAAFAIVVYHAWWPFSGSQELGLLHWSYTAVGFFFTLSGLVLAWSWRSGTGVVVQWRRRAARILPLHWLTLGMMLSIYLVAPGARPLADTKSALVDQVFLLQAWPPFDSTLTFNYPSWSLSTEAFCYLLFPFLMWGLSRLAVRRLLTLAGVLIAAYAVAAVALHKLALPALSDGNILALPPLQFVKFAAGAAVGTALAQGWRPRVPMWTALVALAGTWLALPTLTTADLGFAAGFRAGALFPDLVLVGPMMLLVIAAAGSDLRGAQRDGRPGWLGRSRVFTKLGEWSFAMYLVHAPLLYVTYGWRVTHPESSGVPGLIWLPVYLLVAIGAAALLHTMFEAPVERWIRRREPARAAAAGPRSVPTARTPDLPAIPAPRAVTEDTSAVPAAS